MGNKIILEANTILQDNELREYVERLVTKIETLNNRTKNHTLQIRDIQKRIKQDGK